MDQLDQIKDEHSLISDTDNKISTDSGFKSDEGESSSSYGGGLEVLTRKSDMVKVREESIEHDFVMKTFLSGLCSSFAKHTQILAIHKNVNSNFTQQAKFEAFQIYCNLVAKKCGGDPNVKLAWYGASKDELCEIVSHGFSREHGTVNDSSFGVGVHLFPLGFSNNGALSSVDDENEQRHVLLCRVIMGKMEEIPLGSKQFRPSSEEYESGVDNLSFPKTYVIWDAYRNSHIFPEYIITFQSPYLRGFQRMNEANALKPTSPWMSFPDLMGILSKLLHPSKLVLIDHCYTDFQAKKITRPQLIRRVRDIAGDKLLYAVMKSCRSRMKTPNQYEPNF